MNRSEADAIRFADSEDFEATGGEVAAFTAAYVAGFLAGLAVLYWAFAS